MNDAMCQILGYTRDEFLTLTAFDVLDEEGRIRFASRIRRGQAGEKLDEAVEYRVRTKDGWIIWTLLNTSFRWEGDRIAGAIAENKSKSPSRRRPGTRILNILLDSVFETV